MNILVRDSSECICLVRAVNEKQDAFKHWHLTGLMIPFIFPMIILGRCSCKSPEKASPSDIVDRRPKVSAS